MSRPSEEITQAAEPTLRLERSAAVARGASVGRYVALDEIGRGAMGVVYAAYDPKLDRKVAVKVLKDLGCGELHLREAQALARLNHPNVVHVYDVGEHEHRVFIAMEFVVGRSLGAWREHAKPSLPALLRVFQHAAAGLAAAHDAGLVHRDFKPDNVMVADDGRVLVMDFGLAVPRQPDAQATEGGKLWASGTPAYMSPEQFCSEPLDPRSDQFSFFVALYEALVGERPFAGASLATLAISVTTGRIAQPNSLRGVPGWLRRLVLRGLSVAPVARHESMQRVAEQLERGMGSRRRRIVGGVGSLVVVAGLGAWWFGSNASDPEAQQCRARARALAEEWAPDWKPQAGRIFVDTVEVDGEETWRRVEANVDRFVGEWSTAYDQACTGRFATQALEPDAFALRMRCLDDQAEYATSLLGSLELADGQGLREIAAVTAELPGPDACDSDRLAKGRFDEASQARVAQAQRQLARVQGRIDAGDRRAARELAKDALKAIEGIAAPVTRAQLLDRLGLLEYDEGDLAAGSATMKAALLEASRSGEPALLASAWISRIEFALSRDRDYRRVAHMMEAVEVAVAANPGDLEIESDLESLRGMLALEEGRGTDARDSFAASLELAERAERETTKIVVILSRLGAAETGLGHLVQGRAQFTRAADLAASVFGERHPVVISIYANLGLICAQEGDAACQRELARKTVELSDPGTPARAKQLLRLGQLEYDERDIEAAERHARESIAIYVELYGARHPDLTGPRLLLSNVLHKQGDLDGAYAQALEVSEIAEATTPPGHPKRALAKSTLGEALRRRGDLEPALAAHREALALRQEGLEPSDPRIGYSLVNTAHCLRELGRAAEARALALQAITVLDAAPGTETWRAEARFIVARALDADDPEAARLARDALEIYEAVGPGTAIEAQEVRTWLATLAKGMPDTSP